MIVVLYLASTVGLCLVLSALVACLSWRVAVENSTADAKQHWAKLGLDERPSNSRVMTVLFIGMAGHACRSMFLALRAVSC